MSTFSRRRVLLAMAAAPVSMLASAHALAAPLRAISARQAMRYLHEEVFPSPQQKREESRKVLMQTGNTTRMRLPHILSFWSVSVR